MARELLECQIIGRITTMPVQETENGHPVVGLKVSVRDRRAVDDEPPIVFAFRAWGACGRRIAERSAPGVRVYLQGRLFLDRNGTEPVLTLLADQAIFLDYQTPRQGGPRQRAEASHDQ